MEFEIKDFLGIASSNRNPLKNQAQALLNFELRNKYGDMTLKAGYTLKYAAPSSVNFPNLDVLYGSTGIVNYCNIENFYVPDHGGQEVTCLVGKSRLKGETSGQTLGAPASRYILSVWARKWWNGSAWTDSWNWLNQCKLTKIRGIDGTDKEKIQLDYTESLTAKEYSKWTIINLTKDPKEAFSVLDSYNVGGGQVGVIITSDTHKWAASDEVIIMKNFIPYDEMVAMGSSVVPDDIVFHKVLNDLRIGFGGEDNRIGLSVGFRSKAFRIGAMAIGSLSPSEIEAYSTYDELILDTYNGYGGLYDLSLSMESAGSDTLPIGHYYFKLVALLDDFNYFLVAENNLDVTSTGYQLNIVPKIKWGLQNKRITKFILFWSNDNELWYKANEFKISDAEYITKDYQIDSDGYVKPIVTFNSLYTSSDALNPTSEANSVSSWSTLSSLVTISSVAAAPAPQDGTYCLKAVHSSASNYNIGLDYLFNLNSYVEYNFDFYVRSKDAVTLQFYWLYDGGRIHYKNWFIPADTWTRINENLITGALIISGGFKQPIGFSIGGIISNSIAGGYIALDKFYIYQVKTVVNFGNSSLLTLDEITDLMGYFPDAELAKSWDQVIVSAGKTMMVNPFIGGERIKNKIFFSPNTGAGAPQYDIITSGNYWDLENFDGNDLIGIEKLPNLDISAFKRNSVQYLDPDTGATKTIEFGKGCISRKTIVNFGDKIAYAGIDGIYMTDGLNIVDISDKTIREEYRQFMNTYILNYIHATREERDNSYRIFFINDALNVKREYILTKKGWQKIGQFLTPDQYVVTRDGKNLFLSNFNNGVYEINPLLVQEYGGDIIAQWKSVPFDIDLLGEQITHGQRIYIKRFWINYESTVPLTMNLYLDGTLFDTFDASISKTKDGKPTKLGASCNYFELEVIVETNAANSAVSIKSLGVEWKPVKAGRFNYV